MAIPTSEDPLAGFSANEHAILERVPTIPLRRLAAAIVRLKMRLQFTGWLQYVIPVVPATGLGLLGGLVGLAGLPWVGGAFGGLATALFALIVFDIVTVKLRLSPPEPRPRPNTHLDAFEIMRRRRSCRSFQTRAMTDPDREALLDSVARHTAEATLGPSPVRLEFVQAPLTVWPTVNASEFLIAVLPRPYDRRSIIDVGRVLQKVVLDATRLGLGTCWIGPGADPETLAHYLGDRYDPEHDLIIVTCAVGYPSLFAPLFVRTFSRAMRHRHPLEDLFFTDIDRTRPSELGDPAVAPFVPAMEACRWGPSSYNGQTTRAVTHVEGGRLQRVDFCPTTASHYYAPVALGIWCANWEVGCQALGEVGRFVAEPPPDGDVVLPRVDVTWERAERPQHDPLT